ncbi:hypothetical protein BOTNAR_0263g00140 [Botryotinia narcissicola]|uniref:Uncharacterized protein n=1 Tax=Botryotinia narcissicola TaxID=278944 RepID=A0A4Z1I546_9HELO|nr:hypothetical protein BOTNAR_0263g00140 [Botryotinia narcissicola]
MLFFNSREECFIIHLTARGKVNRASIQQGLIDMIDKLRSNSSDEQAYKSNERETFGHFQQIDSRYDQKVQYWYVIILGAQRSGGHGSKDS